MNLYQKTKSNKYIIDVPIPETNSIPNNIKIGDTFDLFPNGKIPKDYKCYSSNNNILTIDENGKVTIKGKGTGIGEIFIVYIKDGIDYNAKLVTFTIISN
jgi:hypothetical protein